MAAEVENALFQWQEGERRVRAAPEPQRARLERSAESVRDELRRRLGSSFLVRELAALYDTGVDWAASIVDAEAVGTELAWVVDAAFADYAREAADFAGGRAREGGGRP